MPRKRKTPKSEAAVPNMGSLRLADISKLETLSHGVLMIVFSFLTTAQSVARLASTCKKLEGAVRADGWRIFVCSRFDSLTLPLRTDEDGWMDLARTLTWQSRAWDRRAFSLASLVPPVKQQLVNVPGRNGRGGRGGRQRGRGGRGRRGGVQTFPPHVVVDASSKLSEGRVEEETVAWGAGEDVVIRWRELRHSSLNREEWGTFEGAVAGFQSGTDDVTAISILSGATANPALLIGRASGHLQLSSINPNYFGHSIAWFQPLPKEMGKSLEQKEIQQFDTSVSQNTITVVTKDNLFFYPLIDTQPSSNQDELVVAPTESFDVRNMQNSQEFGVLREAKFMGNGDLALGMSSSPAPLRYLTRTPSGTIITNAAKMQPSRRCTESYVYTDGRPQALRSILPVNKVSAAGGSGTVILSSYDDGTIRLQDLRSSSAIDTTYQDHFEVTTPVGPLISYGTERFVVGSARTAILQIFDFRWPKNYYYTAALSCGKSPLGPIPKPLTWMSPPQYPEIARCSYLTGQSCRLHILARTNFYRPNCNIYLPNVHRAESPVYSLAKSSDISPVIYAGLAGELVKVSLRDQEQDKRESFLMQQMGKKNRHGYDYRECLTSIVETSDGIALSDSSKSQRVPAIYKQRGVLRQQFGRLDETLT
jgi:hypothetical protein